MSQTNSFLKFFYTVLFLLFICYSLSAQESERKIIVRNSHFFYTTIDDELQLASLHTGSINHPLKKAKSLAIPAGRNMNDPIIPFCWDIADKNMFSINFITNAMNSKSKALKLFPLTSLKEWSTANTTISTILEMSFEHNTLTYFAPHEFVSDRSSIRENFFFDGITLSDSSICVAIANRGELSFWKFENNTWQHSEIINLPIDNYFSLFTHKNNVYLILNNGKLYSISTSGIKELPEKRINTNLKDIVLLVNKDEDTIQFIARKHINQPTPFNEVVQKNAMRIF